MAPDERSRVEASQALTEQLGPAAAAALMECIPPFGWHEIATKDDLRQLERRMDLRFDALEARFDAKFEALESKFDALESKFVGLEARFDGLESKFVGLDAKFVGLEAKFVGLDAKFEGRLHAEITRMIKWTVGTIFGGCAALAAAAAAIAAWVG